VRSAAAGDHRRDHCNRLVSTTLAPRRPVGYPVNGVSRDMAGYQADVTIACVDQLPVAVTGIEQVSGLGPILPGAEGDHTCRHVSVSGACTSVVSPGRARATTGVGWLPSYPVSPRRGSPRSAFPAVAAHAAPRTAASSTGRALTWSGSAADQPAASPEPRSYRRRHGSRACRDECDACRSEGPGRGRLKSGALFPRLVAALRGNRTSRTWQIGASGCAARI
jgi:hypothetical protein